jgi:hypothetical protein
MAIFRGGEERRIAGLGETCHFAHLQFSVLREMEADRRALLRKWSISAGDGVKPAQLISYNLREVPAGSQ